MKVTIGAVTYQPIELHGNYANLGKPAESTRMDLTLGEDSDGDGLPDTWEYLLIAMLGGNLTLNDISPEADSDGDGLSNLQEYIAGTYAFDRQDGVSLDIVGYRNGRPQLDFMAIRGRSYTILASSNLTPAAWSAVDFAMPAEPSGSTPLTRYAASDVRVVRAEAIIPTNQTPRIKFFKLQVQ
jgi:hypothetical protein